MREPSAIVAIFARTTSGSPIVDRAREHLGPSDTVIIRVRKRLIEAALSLRDAGTAPPGVDRPELYAQRPVGIVLEGGADWVEASRERRESAHAQ